MSILHIASGQCVADDLIAKGVKNVYAFNEAMCEGFPKENIFSNEFCEERAVAYNTSLENYHNVSKKLCLTDVQRVELYFDYDMFCCVNAITLLAYLEQVAFSGEIIFHLVKQDGTANIIKTFPVSCDGYKQIYLNVLVLQKETSTNNDIFNKGIELYLKYKQPHNEITEFITARADMQRKELCILLLKTFADYGVGDISFYNLIDRCRQ